MKIIISHPTGNANLRAVAHGLLTSQQLYRFYTTIAAFKGSLLYKAGVGPLGELRRRTYDTALAPYTATSPWYEAGRMLSTKLKLRNWTRHEQGVFSVDNVYRRLDRYVAGQLKPAQRKGANAVYAYEDGALESFHQAKALGMQCLYDLPIGYWRAMHRLLKVEQEKYPEWAATLTGFHDSATKLARKDKELQGADHIFVASSFTAATLKDYPGKLAPVSVIPYGFPTPVSNRQYQPLQQRPLRLLFVGGLSQRKGLANLFEAVAAFGNKVELTVVGGKAAHDCAALDTALAKHRWIPSLPHGEILQLMQTQDVFVFPSLFEGFGLVITEAMSQGTPVITTERTVGPDLIRHRENGWLTEAGNTEALKAAIEHLLFNPAQIMKAGLAAIESARERPWPVYGKELSAAIAKLD